MLSGVGWLIVVWAVWTIISLVTAFLIRFALRGQQETVEAQERAIDAAMGLHGADELPAAPSGAAPESTPPVRPPQPFGPPIGAT